MSEWEKDAYDFEQAQPWQEQEYLADVTERFSPPDDSPPDLDDEAIPF